VSPWIRCVIACLSMLGLCACAPRQLAAQEGVPDHIVLVTIEGLRFDRVGAYAPWLDRNADPDAPAAATVATPNLDRLAKNALVYGYALATSSWCAPSLASVLTSRYPSDLGFTDLTEPLRAEVHTLPEVLRRAGWKTQALVEHPFLGARMNLDQGFEQYEQVEGESARARSLEVTQRALKVIAQMGSRRTFLWVQLGGLGPPFEVDGVGDPLSREDWLRYRDEWTPEDLLSMQQLYNQEVEQIDREVGQLLDALDDAGVASRTALVLTSSNGCELLEHGMVGDATSLRAPLVRVPLLLSVRGQHAGAIEEPVSLVDVAPSLLRLVGLSAPSDWQGVSILPGDPAPERSIYSELSRARKECVAVHGDWKVLWNQESGEVSLFDVYSDPLEATNLADQKGAIRVELMDNLRQFVARGATHASAE